MADLFDLPFDDPPPAGRDDASPPPKVDPAPARPPSPSGATPGAAPARRIFTVSELTGELRGLLETTYGELWIDGELSNFRRWRTGHVYFTLKDAGAQLKGVMFRSAARYLRFTPEDGMRVIARGRLGVYEPKGEYQIVCEHLEPHGVGALQLAFEQLKRRLEGEGLFDPARKRSLPALPRKIGIVTSLDGAALRDIIHVLRRRYPNAHLLIRPARVQGEGAASEVARGLTQLAAAPGVDVVIVGRGGGSIEDLWAFNEEAAARAIVDSPVPVISAVGHETDFTIADFAADLRAATPSAAAELVVTRKDEFEQRIDRMQERLRASAIMTIREGQKRVREFERRPGLAGWPARLALTARRVVDLTHGVARSARGRVGRDQRRYHALRLRLEARDLRRTVGTIAARLAGSDGRMAGAMSRLTSYRREGLGVLTGRLENLSPLAVLGRGYAVCWNDDRSAIVSDAGAIETGDRVHVTLHQGELDCTVTGRDRARRVSDT
ncbi:MAG: exodeoxyribonuclease VII large subunit [Acidobacteria bacterium]|nr:exodeoxyribonuclease VII large subunit [Acidobacteriota bacterium]